jgi:hypothetical protein
MGDILFSEWLTPLQALIAESPEEGVFLTIRTESFTFKGETIRLHIITSEEEQPQEDLNEEIRANNYITLLDKPITEHISTVILRIINGKYGESSEPLARTINYLSGETETSPARNVLFL